MDIPATSAIKKALRINALNIVVLRKSTKGVKVIFTIKLDKKIRIYTYMIRKYVYQTCLGNFFDPLTFGSADLGRLFRQYDLLCFQNDFERRSNRQMKFLSSPREVGALGTFQVGRSDIVIEVAPRVISAAFLRNPLKFKLLGGEPCETEAYAVLFVLEHILIHLLIEVFASHDSGGEILDFARLATYHFLHPTPAPKIAEQSPSTPDCSWYSNQCILVSILTPLTPKSRNPEGAAPLRGRFAPGPLRSGVPTNFYQLQQNSCYLDTILMIMLGGGSPAWRETIFMEDVNHTDYGHFLSAFPTAASVDRVRSVAYQLQTSLFDDYSVIFSRQGLRGEAKDSGLSRCLVGGSDIGTLTSTSIRDCFASILPDMKLGGAWAPFSASEIYDLLADFFPGLKTQCPVRIVKDGDAKSFQTRPRNLLQMWDYMDPLTDTEGSYEEILWDEIASPMLVFQNGSHPPIREFDSLRPEVVVTDNTRKTVNKQRAFGETIMQGRYRLGGVATLVGGGHYIGYIRLAEAWYYYNDSGPVFRELASLPRKGVWKEYRGEKPDLLFYFLDSK